MSDESYASRHKMYAEKNTKNQLCEGSYCKSKKKKIWNFQETRRFPTTSMKDGILKSLQSHYSNCEKFRLIILWKWFRDFFVNGWFVLRAQTVYMYKYILGDCTIEKRLPFMHILGQDGAVNIFRKSSLA